MTVCVPGEAGHVSVKADHERWRSNSMQKEKKQTKNMLHDKKTIGMFLIRNYRNKFTKEISDLKLRSDLPKY